MYSTMWRAWLDLCVQSKVAGSSIFWTCMATRRMPPFLAFGSSTNGIGARLREGGRRQAGHGVGGAGRDAGQRGDADELAAAQPAALHQIERLLGFRMEAALKFMRR